jgi:hypothetical protein
MLWTDGSETKIVTPIMPSITFQEGGKTFFSITSKGLLYNQDTYPNDTYKDAGTRIFYKLYPLIKAHFLETKKPIVYTLDKFMEYPTRNVTITKQGLTHDYENITVWMWWVVDVLNTHIKNTRW